jgi:hypothetical protein
VSLAGWNTKIIFPAPLTFSFANPYKTFPRLPYINKGLQIRGGTAIFIFSVKRVSAVISLFAFTTLFIEVAKLPSACVEQSESKCAMMKMHPNCKMLAERMKTQGQKKNKCNSNTCSNCPLFAVATLKGIIALVPPKPFIQLEYPVMLNNNLADYYSQHWKPPNFRFS